MVLKGLSRIVREKTMRPLPWTIIVLAVITTGCAVSGNAASPNDISLPAFAVDEDFDLFEEDLAEQKVEASDPLEGINRIMFGLNDVLYFWLLKPCAVTCEEIVPRPVRVGVRNFFRNLSAPVRFVNCHLQGKTADADTELNRFLINTTVGILGFGDPAKDQYDLVPVEEDLGQTLATYGFDNGFYIVLPLLGPSTLRDSVGFLGDMFLNPTNYVEPAETAIAISATKYVNESSFHIGEYESFKSAAVDPYVAMRRAYIQYRNKQVQE